MECTFLRVETTVNKIEVTTDLIKEEVDSSVKLLQDTLGDIGKIEKTSTDVFVCSEKTFECVGKIHTTVDHNKIAVDTVHQIVQKVQTTVEPVVEVSKKGIGPVQWTPSDWIAYFHHSKLAQEVCEKIAEETRPDIKKIDKTSTEGLVCAQKTIQCV